MKNNFVLTTRTSYSYYKNQVESPLHINDYLHIVYSFFEFIKDKILDGDDVTIPEKLGLLNIQGKKQKIKMENDQIINLNPDWKSTNELWERCEECKERKQLVYYFNEHTNGILYKIKWSKTNVLVRNKMMYYFKPCRKFKRTLAKLIKEGKEYISYG